MPRSRPSSILIQTDCILLPPSPPKRIRFAPLPQPDRIENDTLDTTIVPNHSADLCDPDSPPEDLFASSSSSSSSSSGSQLFSSTNSAPFTSGQTSSPDSSVGSSPIIHPALPSKYPSAAPLNSNANTNSPVTSDPQGRSWGSILRPFKRLSPASSSDSSSHTLTPTPSIENHTHGVRRSITKEEIFTLGAVNLFRPASRESTRSSVDNSWSSGLTRLATLGGSNATLPRTSAPLTRTQSIQSTQSYKSKSARLSIFSSSSSSLSSDSKSKSKPAPVPQHSRTNRHKGTRMLNGRVYGGPKKNPNPFANARDEEPEFVEWGYGGMGSVKGAMSAGVGNNWQKLQGGSAMSRDDKPRIEIGVGGVGAGIGATNPDLDDGSGLAWVKRRREERERKAREQKEKEQKDAEKENSESQLPTPTAFSTVETDLIIPEISLPSSSVNSATHIPPAIEVSPLTIVPEEDGETATHANFPTPTPSRHPSRLGISTSSLHKSSSSLSSINTNQGKPDEGDKSQLHNNATTHENERVLQAITVPIRSLRHHRSSSKGKEMLSTDVSTAAVSPPTQVVGSPLVSPSGGDNTADVSTRPLHTITPLEIDKPASSSSSESGSESEIDEDGDDEDDDEEDEDSQKQSRKNTLGNAAGVEKISRHKE